MQNLLFRSAGVYVKNFPLLAVTVFWGEGLGGVSGVIATEKLRDYFTLRGS